MDVIRPSRVFEKNNNNYSSYKVEADHHHVTAQLMPTRKNAMHDKRTIVERVMVQKEQHSKNVQMKEAKKSCEFYYNLENLLLFQ